MNNKIIDIKVFKGYTKDKTFMIRESKYSNVDKSFKTFHLHYRLFMNM